MRGEFVMVVQRRHVQYLDYLQGLLLLFLHPPWEYQVDEILKKHSVVFPSVNTSQGKKTLAEKLSIMEEQELSKEAAEVVHYYCYSW